LANYGIIGFVVTLSFPRFFLSSISSTSFVMVRSVGLLPVLQTSVLLCIRCIVLLIFT